MGHRVTCFLSACRPTHRDKTAMNGAQSYLSCRWPLILVSGVCPVSRHYRDERVLGKVQRSYDSTMPYGLKRFQKAEALHFITFSCFHRLPFLEAPETRETFENVLEQTRSHHQARSTRMF